jgi:integrase
MGRLAKFSFTMADQTRVPYGFKERNGVYYVRFVDPDGKAVLTTTGCDTLNDAHTAAAKIVLKAFTKSLPPDPKKTGWEEAERELDLRSDSIRGYQTTLRRFRELIPEPQSPADVTQEHASRFKRLYMKKGKAQSCRTYLRSLRSLWNKHLKELGYVATNPFAAVAYPEVEQKVVVIPAEDSVGKLLNWMNARYPDWELLHLFTKVKMLTGCRLLDLCSAESSQLKNGILTFTPSTTKTKKLRSVPLPADLAARLEAIKGKKYLWEQFAEDAKTYRPGKRCPPTGVFSIRTWYWAVSNIFREYNEQHPTAKVRTHDLRKRAITLTTLATGSVDATAQAIGLDAQTARRYYVDAQRAFDGHAVMQKMAGVLLPNSGPQTTTTKEVGKGES